jgi:arginase family enzyme
MSRPQQTGTEDLNRSGERVTGGPFPEEFGWARSKSVRWHLMGEIFERGIVAVIDNVLTEIADAEHLFLCPSTSTSWTRPTPLGTGTPGPGGMTSRELPRAGRRLTVERGLVGMDLVEVSPPRPRGHHGHAAHRAVCEGTKRSGAQQAKRQAQAREPLTVHPSYCS